MSKNFKDELDALLDDLNKLSDIVEDKTGLETAQDIIINKSQDYDYILTINEHHFRISTNLISEFIDQLNTKGIFLKISQ